jgi:DNA-binding response OmpR family regulator
MPLFMAPSVLGWRIVTRVVVRHRRSQHGHGSCDLVVTGQLTSLDASGTTCPIGVTGTSTRKDTAPPVRVLVVEDHEVLARTIGMGLRQEGMAVDVVLDGDDALFHIATTHYDVVVLDRDLPGTHGDDVCRRLAAARSASRVLMLTAASTVRERVEGLGLGADDYLPKPFDFSELIARVRALGRRSLPPLPPTLESGEVTLDPSARVAARAGRRLALTPKEFAVLECLLARQGTVVSAEDLLERVWDEAANPFTNTVKSTIGRLRAKLGDPPLIETVREGGYRIGGK